MKKIQLEYVEICSYLNMFVFPRTTTQPCDSLTGASTSAAFTMQRAPGEGTNVAAPPSSSMMLQWDSSMEGPYKVKGCNCYYF